MKTNTNKEEIFALIDDKNLGKETRVPAVIRNVATTFYKELWKNRQGTRAHSKRKISQMLDKIQRKVDNTTKIEEDKPITMEEVKEATKALLTNKSPGIDGIPTKFYQTFEYVTEWLFGILQELNEQKQQTETMRTSIVKIIYKKRQENDW